jgi:hypothetical protein
MCCKSRIVPMTTPLLATTTLFAIVVRDLALVLAVGGGTFSTADASVFPALIFRAAVQNKKNGDDEKQVDSRDELEAKVALLLMYVLIGIGITGVSVALANVQSYGL